MIEISEEIIVEKDPAEVWDLLTNISNWGRWTRVMKHSAVYGPLTPGTAFKCIAGKWDFEGKIGILEFGKSIDFEAKSIGLKIAMRWEFSSCSKGTKVAVEAVIEGWIPRFFARRVQTAVRDSIFTWLYSLKTTAERGNIQSGKTAKTTLSQSTNRRKIQITGPLSFLFKPKDSDE